ncbi:type II toxin-antitoxin system VapC family toxin [Labrys wisconsinensis]|uniref:Nucleic acid-binding protein n=1 Tax=Labrys wisconsinensis TaxID=425677 RepID=A0ABU0J1Y7_9HYPH|nr:type II toxin-antitoxin system VapC family toxin [Labrys wisconsinensis]MDQ0467458.1 putative nucleic acid-binding protein [Labrys wisconsinensis]
MAPRIYIDTNIFITLVEGSPTPSLTEVIALVESGKALAFTSDLTIAEVLVHPYADGDDARAQAYIDMISPNEVMRIVPVEREVLIRAARLRSLRRSLKLPDAIHAASAELADCGIFLSNDADIEVRGPMQRVGLEEDDLQALIAFLA